LADGILPKTYLIDAEDGEGIGGFVDMWMIVIRKVDEKFRFKL
jgi:hypothetical protein